MAVVASGTVGVEAQPTEDQLWALGTLFLANWGASVQVSEQWLTDVVAAQSVLESRAGARNRPYRTVRFTLRGLRRSNVRALRAFAMRAASARLLVPIYPDFTKLTADRAPGDALLPCDATYRRLYAGGRVVIARPDFAASSARVDAAALEVATLSAVADNQLTLSAGLAGTFPAGTRVYPLVECQPALVSQLVIQTDDKVDLALAADESVGTMTLPATQAANTVPAGFLAAADGLPVMGLPVSWVNMQHGISRPAATAQSGLVTLHQLKGARPLATAALSYQEMNRAAAWALKRFFDSRRGRTYPFYLPASTSDLSPQSIVGSELRVDRVGPQLDWTFFPYVALYIRSTAVVRVFAVAAVDRQPTYDGLTLTGDGNGALPALADVRRATAAAKSRLDTDEMVEDWQTDHHMSTSLSFVEVVDRDFTIGVPDHPAPTAPTAPAPPGPFDCSDHTRIFTVHYALTPDVAGVPNPSGAFVVAWNGSLGLWTSGEGAYPVVHLTCSTSSVAYSAGISWLDTHQDPVDPPIVGVLFDQDNGDLALPPFPDQPITGFWVTGDAKRQGVRGPFYSQSGGFGSGEPVHDVTLWIEEGSHPVAPTDPEPLTGFVQLKDCTNALTTKYVPDQGATFYLYDPVSSQSYSALETNRVDVLPPGSSLLEGWTTLDHPPGDPLNPAWVPACGDPTVAYPDCGTGTTVPPPQGVTGFFGTGQEASGGLDLHWRVNRTAATVVTAGQGGTWLAPTAPTTWIADAANVGTTDPYGKTYFFETDATVALDKDMSTFSVVGHFAIAYRLLDVVVNGVSTGISYVGVGGSDAAYTAFTLDATKNLQHGLNKIEFLVQRRGVSLPTANPYGLTVKWDAPTGG